MRRLPAILLGTTLAGGCENPLELKPEDIQLKDSPCTLELTDWPKVGDAMPALGDLCKPEFSELLASIDAGASDSVLTEKIARLAAGGASPYIEESSSRQGGHKFVVHFPEELRVTKESHTTINGEKQPDRKVLPTITIGRAKNNGEVYNVKLEDHPAFDFKYDDNSMLDRWQVSDDGKSLEWTDGRWKFTGKNNLSVQDTDQDGDVDELRYTGKNIMVLESADKKIRITADQGKLTVKRGEQTVLSVDTKNPLSLKDLYAYFQARVDMINYYGDIHNQKARGEGAYNGTEEELCIVVQPEVMMQLHPSKQEDSRDLDDRIQQGHPYQNLAARALTKQVVPGAELHCPQGHVDSHDIVAAIEGNLYLDEETGVLHVRLVDDENSSSQNEPELFGHQTAWALHALAMLWDENELRSEKAKSLMAQIKKDNEQYREEAFAPQKKEGTYTMSGKEMFRIAQDLYVHNQMALATYAVRSADATMIKERVEVLLIDVKRTAELPEYDSTLVSHLMQVAGILAPVLSQKELMDLKPLFKLYATHVQESLNGEDAMRNSYDGLSSAHAMVGLREFVRLSLLEQVESGKLDLGGVK